MIAAGRHQNKRSAQRFARLFPKSVNCPIDISSPDLRVDSWTSAFPNNLSDLSARAKSAKDAIDIAKTETGEKLAAHKEEARAAAAAAIEKISTEIKSMRGTVDKNWNVIRAKIDADIDALIARVTADEHDLEVNHLVIRADKF